jgi:predicted RecB family nuclease
LGGEFPSIKALAGIDPAAYVVKGKTIFPGIGPESLDKFHRRAKLISTPGAKPYLRSPLKLPKAEIDIFFDIEVDPMRDICYLHGFLERDAKGQESYSAFFAELLTEKDEGAAFEAAWKYIQSRGDAILYYYSKYERTIYRKLQAKYPAVCTAEAVEKVFDPAKAVDLYGDVVARVTEWPTRDYSLKTLAAYLGFRWRDTHPSGAASIEWFDQWVKTRDPAIKQRIVEYNEDDCRATRVLLDGVRTF